MRVASARAGGYMSRRQAGDEDILMVFLAQIHAISRKHQPIAENFHRKTFDNAHQRQQSSLTPANFF